MNRSAPDLLRRTLVLALTTLALALPARAQFSSTPSPEELVRASAAPVKLAASGRGEAVVTLKVLDGWHINANPAGNDFMIPTEVELSPAGGVAAGAPRSPEPELVTLSFDPQPQKVWSHEVTIRLPLRAATTAAGGTLKGVARFQACNDQVCLPPAKVPCRRSHPVC